VNTEAQKITYRVKVLPQTHELAVEMTFTLAAPGPALILETPTWVAGDYDFMPFARDLFDLTAVHQASGRPLSVRRDGWQAFQLDAPAGTIVVTYRAHAGCTDFAEPCGIVDGTYAIVLGTRYLHLAGSTGPCSVQYEVPDNWKIHHPSGARSTGTLSWEYPGYEILVDTPVTMGSFDLFSRKVRGTDFFFVFVDRTIGFESQVAFLVDRLAQVAEKLHEVFGSFPYEDYTFIMSFNPTADWGLEHLTSTMCGLGPDVFIDPDQFANAVRVCAHEAFHAWNVRRLRPSPLKELDFKNGTFTEGLWVAEGFTRYYEFLLSTRVGAYTPEQFFSAVVNYYRHLSVTPAYARVTAVDSSLATYLNHAKYPGRSNNAIDYYDKGMLIAFLTDTALRHGKPADALDAAFRAFYQAFVEAQPGYTPENVAAFFNQRQPALGDTIRGEAETLSDLRIEDLLVTVGFQVKKETVHYLGLMFDDSQGPAIYGVLDTSPASLTGIASDDVLVTVNGFPFSFPRLSWVAARQEAVVLGVLRGHRRMEFTIVPGTYSRLASLKWQGTEADAAIVRTWLENEDFRPAAGTVFALDFYENFHGVETVV